MLNHPVQKAQGVTVKIGKFDLRLSPLADRHLAAAEAVALRLKATY